MTSNQLKILALVTMTIDHVGYMIFPGVLWLRIIGRIAFPIFAYCIAEGCFYTHDKRRYLGGIVALGALCQVVYLLAMGSLEQTILTTLALGIMVVYAMQNVAAKRSAGAWGLLALAVAFDAFVCFGIPQLAPRTDFGIDYGFVGTLLPAVCYLPRLLFADKPDQKRRGITTGFAAVGIAALAIAMTPISSWVQWAGLLAVPALAAYNGKRGKLKLKYLFYIYYPAHLVVIWAISQVI